MTQGQGETAVTTSALILTGLYGYRKATETFKREPSAHNAGAPLRSGLKAYVEGPLGVGELEPLGQWATGMGLTFILLSIAASVNSTFGGSFAILAAVGGTLGNGKAVLQDLKSGLSGVGGAASEYGVKSSRGSLEQRQPREAVSSNHPPVK